MNRRWIRRTILLAALPLVFVAPAAGDIVITDRGVRLEGRVLEQGDEVIVEVEYGQVTLKRAQVREIIRQESPLEEFRRRRAALAAGDAEGCFALGLWCRERELAGSAAECFARTLELAPGHEGAHRALGHEPSPGGWLTEEQQRRLAGLVPYRGQWLPGAELAQRLERAERELDRAARDSRDLAARLSAAEAAATQLQARLAAAEQELNRWRYTVPVIIPAYPPPRPRHPPGPRDGERRPGDAGRQPHPSPTP